MKHDHFENILLIIRMCRKCHRLSFSFEEAHDHSFVCAGEKARRGDWFKYNMRREEIRQIVGI